MALKAHTHTHTQTRGREGEVYINAGVDKAPGRQGARVDNAAG